MWSLQTIGGANTDTEFTASRENNDIDIEPNASETNNNMDVKTVMSVLYKLNNILEKKAKIYKSKLF